MSASGFELMASMESEDESGDQPTPQEQATFKINEIDENPYQPRDNISEEEFKELVSSIRQKGVLTPITIRINPKNPERFQVVAGQRRLKACSKARLDEIPCFLRPVSDEEMLELALIENITRSDLTAMQEANGFSAMMTEFGVSQKELAKKFSKTEKYISDTLGLLDLPPIIKAAWEKGATNSRQTASELRKALEINEDDVRRFIADNSVITYKEALMLHKELKENGTFSTEGKIVEGNASSQNNKMEDHESVDEKQEEEFGEVEVNNDNAESEPSTVSYESSEPAGEIKDPNVEHKISIVVEILNNLDGADLRELAETIVDRLAHL